MQLHYKLISRVDQRRTSAQNGFFSGMCALLGTPQVEKRSAQQRLDMSMLRIWRAVNESTLLTLNSYQGAWVNIYMYKIYKIYVHRNILSTFRVVCDHVPLSCRDRKIHFINHRHSHQTSQ